MAGHIIIFEHDHFRGHHRHIFNEEVDLNHPEDRTLNDKVSSVIILEGKWQFFRHGNFETPYAPILGPGLYPRVKDVKIENDDMSSLKCVG